MRRPLRTADCREASRARDIVTTVGTGLLGLASGTILGLAILFLGLLTVLGAAIATNGRIHVPGLLTAWTTTENGLSAVSFQPEPSGLLAAVAAVAVVHASLRLRSTPRPTARGMRRT